MMRKLFGVFLLLLAIPFALGMIYRLAVFAIGVYMILTNPESPAPGAVGTLMAYLTIAFILGLVTLSCVYLGRQLLTRNKDVAMEAETDLSQQEHQSTEH